MKKSMAASSMAIKSRNWSLTTHLTPAMLKEAKMNTTPVAKPLWTQGMYWASSSMRFAMDSAKPIKHKAPPTAYKTVLPQHKLKAYMKCLPGQNSTVHQLLLLFWIQVHSWEESRHLHSLPCNVQWFQLQRALTPTQLQLKRNILQNWGSDE